MSLASDIKLVFHSSTITMMHDPINIKPLPMFMRIVRSGPIALCAIMLSLFLQDDLCGHLLPALAPPTDRNGFTSFLYKVFP